MELQMSVERELAEHSVEIEHIQKDMDAMAIDIKEIRNSLAEINKTLSEAKGSWKTMMMVAGAASAITGVVATIIHFFTGK